MDQRLTDTGKNRMKENEIILNISMFCLWKSQVSRMFVLLNPRGLFNLRFSVSKNS